MRFSRTAFVAFAAWFAAAIFSTAAFEAQAETQVRMGIQYGLPYLPFAVMEHEGLIEKHAKALGVDDVKVTWFRSAGGNVLNDGLLSNNLDFVATGIVSFLNLWSRAKGKNEIKGLSSYSSSTLLLVTRNPSVKTIADFTGRDKIAVPAVQSSLQAMALQRAAEKAFGPSGRNRLDPIMLSRAHPDAMAAMLSGTEITTHFAAPPYQEMELAKPGVRAILSVHEAFDGPVCNGILYMTERYYRANPKMVAAVNAALQEAEKLINADKRRAAEIYLAVSKEKNTVDAVLQTINAPGSRFEQVPHGVMRIAEFMRRTGAISVAPASWKEIFVPEAHSLPGD